MRPFTRNKAILYLTAIFVAGTAAGFVAGHAIARRQALRPPQAAEMAQHMIAKLKERLKLTPEQLGKIRPLVEQNCAELNAIHHQSWERVSENLKKLNQQIAEHLTVEQKTKLAAMECARREFVREQCGQRDPPETHPSCHSICPE